MGIRKMRKIAPIEPLQRMGIPVRSPEQILADTSQEIADQLFRLVESSEPPACGIKHATVELSMSLRRLQHDPNAAPAIQQALAAKLPQVTRIWFSLEEDPEDNEVFNVTADFKPPVFQTAP